MSDVLHGIEELQKIFPKWCKTPLLYEIETALITKYKDEDMKRFIDIMNRVATTADCDWDFYSIFAELTEASGDLEGALQMRHQVLKLLDKEKATELDKYMEQMKKISCTYTDEMCKTCKTHIVTQKDYCDSPTQEDQKCICSAFRGQWKIFFEDVEDTVRTAENACANICSKGTVPLGSTTASTTASNLTQDGSEMIMIMVSLLMVLIIV